MASSVSNSTSYRRRKMPFSGVEDQQRVVNSTLRKAMGDERSKRWTKVVQSYRRLLRMLNKENLPHDFDPPEWFQVFMYECHYHLGLALQNIGEHKRAVEQYTKALDAIFIPKNGCVAGCHNNSCLMVPLHARRAFACAMSGELKQALKDSEKAVVLDCKNPDVYCIRALVRSSRKEERMALQDVETALKHNPKHLCALILRGTLAQPLILDEWESGRAKMNQDHAKACSINPDCHNYLGVQHFQHPEILSFYDRFLYSLNVPHTISEVDLNGIINSATFNSSTGTSSRPSSRQSTLSRSTTRHSTHTSTHISSRASTRQSYTSAAHNPMKFKQETIWLQNGHQPFRCGMTKDNTKAYQVLKRRKEYGSAVQEYVNRPKTTEEYMAHLEKERQKRDYEKERLKSRPQTAVSTKSEQSVSGESDKTQVNGIARSLHTHLTFDGSSKKTRTTQTIITTQPASTLTAAKRIKVFQEVNVSDAPRMYYRPWLGDKLPVAEIEKREVISPPFKV